MVDLVRTIAAAIAPHVGRDGVKPSIGQRRQLVAPRIPALWEAVAEDHERTRPLLGDAQVNAIRLDHPMLNLPHDVLRK